MFKIKNKEKEKLLSWAIAIQFALGIPSITYAESGSLQVTVDTDESQLDMDASQSSKSKEEQEESKTAKERYEAEKNNDATANATANANTNPNVSNDYNYYGYADPYYGYGYGGYYGEQYNGIDKYNQMTFLVSDDNGNAVRVMRNQCYGRVNPYCTEQVTYKDADGGNVSMPRNTMEFLTSNGQLLSDAQMSEIAMQVVGGNGYYGSYGSYGSSGYTGMMPGIGGIEVNSSSYLANAMSALAGMSDGSILQKVLMAMSVWNQYQDMRAEELESIASENQEVDNTAKKHKDKIESVQAIQKKNNIVTSTISKQTKSIFNYLLQPTIPVIRGEDITLVIYPTSGSYKIASVEYTWTDGDGKEHKEKHQAGEKIVLEKKGHISLGEKTVKIKVLYYNDVARDNYNSELKAKEYNGTITYNVLELATGIINLKDGKEATIVTYNVGSVLANQFAIEGNNYAQSVIGYIKEAEYDSDSGTCNMVLADRDNENLQIYAKSNGDMTAEDCVAGKFYSSPINYWEKVDDDVSVLRGDDKSSVRIYDNESDYWEAMSSSSERFNTYGCNPNATDEKEVSKCETLFKNFAVDDYTNGDIGDPSNPDSAQYLYIPGTGGRDGSTLIVRNGALIGYDSQEAKDNFYKKTGYDLNLMKLEKDENGSYYYTKQSGEIISKSKLKNMSDPASTEATEAITSEEEADAPASDTSSNSPEAESTPSSVVQEAVQTVTNTVNQYKELTLSGLRGIEHKLVSTASQVSGKFKGKTDIFNRKY